MRRREKKERYRHMRIHFPNTGVLEVFTIKIGKIKIVLENHVMSYF